MSRKRLELAVLAFGAAFLLLIGLSFRPGRRPAATSPGPSPETTAPAGAGQATTVLSGVDFTESVRGKPVFRIRSEKTVGFGPGAGLLPNWYALEGVELTVYTEEGTPVTVRGDRADYEERSKKARLTGNVRWTDEDGSLGETERVEFRPDTRTLEISAPLHFVRGTFDLRAASGSYDVRGRLVRLTGPVKGSGTGEGSGGLSELAADGALFRRTEGLVELKGNVAASSLSGDRVTADALVLKLEETGKRVEWARATGHVRGVLAGHVRGVLVGASGGKTPGAPNAASAAPPAAGASMPRSYAGEQAAIFFAADGATRSLGLLGSPAWVEEPARRVEARAIDVAFEGGRAVSATARGEVRIRTQEAAARSGRAAIAFAPGGDVETMELAERVEISAGGRSGRAERVVQVPARSVWLLTGGPGSSATVEDDGARVSAARIELTRVPEGLRAEGNARAVFVGKPGEPRAPTLVGDPGKPTHGKAERMVFDQTARTAHLSGGASLWQGESSLFADDITLNDAARTVVAVGHVRALLERPPAGRGAGAPTRSTITARRMIYQDAGGTATFEDGVSIVRGSWRARAQRGAAYFAGEPQRRIERVELVGSVEVHDAAAGRDATAEKATDYPAEGRTVLEGKPARVSDRDGNRVAGATLTIRDRGRSVEVTAPEGGKTETIHRTKPS